MRTILSRALAELNAHRSVVLVTIVAEQGSAPRGPGSQMLVGADGQLTGTIGGGQVERQSELLALRTPSGRMCWKRRWPGSPLPSPAG